MTPEEKAALEAKTERLEKIVSLSPEQRAYFDTLDDHHKDEHLAKSDADRATAMAEAKKRAEEEEAAKRAADPVVHTTKDGTEIRKSDGPTVLAMAKRQDAQAEELAAEKKQNAELRKAAETAGFEKRAEAELGHLPGSLKVRAMMLKNAEAIEDEAERKEAVAMLKAGSNAMSPMFGMVGTSAGSDIAKAGGAADPDSQIEELAQKYMKDHAGVTIEKARTEVMLTDEGRDILAKAEEQYRQRPHLEAVA